MNQQQLLQLIGGIGGLGGASLPLGQRGTTRPASNQSQESGTPLRVQSAPEAQSADVPATPPQARPVTAAALPGGNSDTPTGRIQISDLQSALLSNAPGELNKKSLSVRSGMISGSQISTGFRIAYSKSATISLSDEVLSTVHDGVSW